MHSREGAAAPRVRRHFSMITGALLLLTGGLTSLILSPVATPANASSSAVAPAHDAGAARAAAARLGEPVEDVSQRTEYAQFFANPDGSWTMSAATEPVRVQDDQGAWHDIDTRLVEQPDGSWAP